MTPVLIAIFAAAGVGGWVWAQLARRTGSSDPKGVALSAGGVTLIVFIIVLTLLKFVFGW